mgnify:CR=1 FL=1
MPAAYCHSQRTWNRELLGNQRLAEPVSIESPIQAALVYSIRGKAPGFEEIHRQNHATRVTNKGNVRTSKALPQTIELLSQLRF